MQPLLDAIVRYLPTPLDSPSRGKDPTDQEKIIELTPDPGKPFVGMAFKIVEDVGKGGLVDSFYIRPSEVVETFQYLYMFYYVIVLRRRLGALDDAGVTHVGLQSEGARV